jgi:predicted transcriptional regulator YdeE
MEVQIITKPAFTVLGIEGRGDADKGSEWIRPLWGQAFKQLGEIKDLVRSDRGAWGLMSATDKYLASWGKEGKYLAG